MSQICFYWNGIKDAKGGKLQRAHYSAGPLHNFPEGTISIYARDYSGFSAKVAEALEVKNDSDYASDYFDKDRIRVRPDHALYAAVAEALKAQQAHRLSKRRREIAAA